MDIAELKKFCGKTVEKDSILKFDEKRYAREMSANRVYITDKGSVLLFLGFNNGREYYFKLGTCMVDTRTIKRRDELTKIYRVLDADIKYSSYTISAFILYTFINRYEDYFMCSCEAGKLNIIGELDYRPKRNEYNSVILKRWHDSYVMGLGNGDHRCFGNGVGTVLIKGAVYRSHKTGKEYIYLGLQYCYSDLMARGDQHLFLEKTGDRCADINEYINRLASSGSKLFAFNLKRKDLECTYEYIKGITLDNNVCLRIKPIKGYKYGMS